MKILLPLLASLALAAVPTHAHAGVEYVLNTNGGVQCNNNSHAEPGFTIDSFSLGGTSPVSVLGGTGSSSGTGGGKLSLADLVINKSFDSCSEQLITGFLSGAIIKTVTLTGYSTTSESKDAHTAILVISLEIAAISNYQLSGSGSLPTESLSFSYRTLCIAGTPLKNDGTSSGNTSHVCYDRQKNVVTR